MAPAPSMAGCGVLAGLGRAIQGDTKRRTESRGVSTCLDCPYSVSMPTCFFSHQIAFDGFRLANCNKPLPTSGAHFYLWFHGLSLAIGQISMISRTEAPLLLPAGQGHASLPNSPRTRAAAAEVRFQR